MYFLPLTLLAFLSSTLATPIPSSDITLASPPTNTTIVLSDPLLARAEGPIGSQKLKGTCPNRHLITEDTYYELFKKFCYEKMPAAGANLGKNVKLEETYSSQSYFGKPIKWYFRISVEVTDDGITRWAQISQSECDYAFESMLTSEYAGGLGKAYCVMGATGGDKIGNEGMSGEGVVGLVKGKVTDPVKRSSGGNFTFEMKQAKGDPTGERCATDISNPGC